MDERDHPIDDCSCPRCVLLQETQEQITFLDEVLIKSLNRKFERS